MLAFLFAALLLAQDPDIDALLKQLSGESIEAREKAAASLVELGVRAEGKLKTASATATGENKARIESVLSAIRDRRRLEAVLPPLKRVTIDVQDRPLKEVLEAWKAQSGFSLTWDPPEARVTVRIREALPIEALDVVCRAAGIGYRFHWIMPISDFDPIPAISVGGTYGEFPRSFAGRYGIYGSRLSVNRMTDFKDTIGTARLDLSVFWPLEVRPHGPPIIEVVSAVDDRGRSLKWEGAEPSGVLTLASGRKPPEREGAWIWLNRPKADAVKIASVTGRLKLRYLVERKYVTFELPLGEKAQVRDYDGIAISLRSVSVENGETRVDLEITGRRQTDQHAETQWYDDGQMRVHGNMAVLKTEKSDSDVSPCSWGRQWCEGKCELSFSFRNVGVKITALQLEVDGVILEDVVPFELKDIPLPN